MKLKTFTLTEQHIKLLQKMWVYWNDCEFGAPAIDPKRPYGNSSVVYDILEILGDARGPEDDLPNELYKAMVKLHEETETALQIVLFTSKFEPGTYRQIEEYDSREWEKV